MTLHVLDNHRNVGNQKTLKPVIVTNTLQYVYDGYTQPVGSERVNLKTPSKINLKCCMLKSSADIVANIISLMQL